MCCSCLSRSDHSLEYKPSVTQLKAAKLLFKPLHVLRQKLGKLSFPKLFCVSKMPVTGSKVEISEPSFLSYVRGLFRLTHEAEGFSYTLLH